MQTTRREFLAKAMGPVVGAGWLATGAASSARAVLMNGEDPKTFFRLFPVGKVEKQGPLVRLRIFDPYGEALLGLEEWSHVNVFYWFDQNDVPEKRRILRVHPQANNENPLTGVFACRAPVRPNLIALSVCKILSVKGNLVHVDNLDAFDGTPVLDLKPFIPPDAPMQDLRVPAWAKGRK